MGTLEKAVVKVLARYMTMTEESLKLIADEIASEYYTAEAEAQLGDES